MRTQCRQSIFAHSRRTAKLRFALLLLIPVFATAAVHADDAIRPYEGNPYYWQYKGQPVLLLGGSDQDNLFNHPDIASDGLEAHLDLLRSVGGNTIRNTMSTRDAGNLFAFDRDPDTGRHDLDRFHDAYWQRLDNLLKLAKARDVIVQIELWDPHDYYRSVGDLGGWAQQPFNPANNVNYTFAESGLIEMVDWSAVHDPDKDHLFFQTAPAERDLALVRRFQERFVDQVLEVSLPYPNVLYCVSNESNDSLHWSDYWAEHLRRRDARAERAEQGPLGRVDSGPSRDNHPQSKGSREMNGNREYIWNWTRPMIGPVMVALSLLLGPCSLSPVMALEVWTLTETRRVLQEEPAGEGREVHLAAARGEAESFQVLMRSAEGASAVELSAETLHGPGGVLLPAEAITLYRQHQLYLDIGTHRNDDFVPGWYPDPLIPFRHPHSGEPLAGARLVAVPFDLPADETHVLGSGQSGLCLLLFLLVRETAYRDRPVGTVGQLDRLSRR